MEYYSLSEQELENIRTELPNNIAFGFESYGNFFFDQETVQKIDLEHGNLLNLIFKSLFNKTKEEFLLERKSDSYEKYILQKEKNADGFDAYEKIVGFINSLGGLGSSMDNEEIPAYLLLTNIRMMLKDGMFETALRYWSIEIVPLNVVHPAIANFAVPIMEQLCRKYGTADERIADLKNVGKGFL